MRDYCVLPLVKHLSALPVKIGLGYKGLPVTNTVAYYENQ
jgi:hypothetical protein